MANVCGEEEIRAVVGMIRTRCLKRASFLARSAALAVAAARVGTRRHCAVLTTPSHFNDEGRSLRTRSLSLL